eukprot:2162443-Rhodomonas_salina.1
MCDQRDRTPSDITRSTQSRPWVKLTLHVDALSFSLLPSSLLPPHFLLPPSLLPPSFIRRHAVPSSAARKGREDMTIGGEEALQT